MVENGDHMNTDTPLSLSDRKFTSDCTLHCLETTGY